MQVNPDIEKVKFWERSEAIPHVREAFLSRYFITDNSIKICELNGLKNAIILFHGLQTFSGAICFNLS
jgi:hypothetical protein